MRKYNFNTSLRSTAEPEVRGIDSGKKKKIDSMMVDDDAHKAIDAVK